MHHRIHLLLTTALCLLYFPASAAADPGARYNSDQLTLTKEQVAGALLTDNFHYTVTLQARQTLADGLLAEELPEGVTLVSAEPTPLRITGRTLYWRIPELAVNDRHTVTIVVRLGSEGTFVTKTWAAPNPMATLPLAAGIPRLEVTKTSPEFAEYGSEFTFNIEVRNTGNAVARNVKVLEIPPPGLSMGNFMPDQGDIPAGQSRNITLTARAHNKGSHTNLARAFHDASPVPAESSATVSVIESRLGIEQTGPAIAWISRPVTWTTTVRNDGECPVNDLVVNHILPYGVRPVADPAAGTPRDLAWRLGSLSPGQSRSFDLIVTSDAPRKATARVTAHGVALTGKVWKPEASVVTTWEAAPGVLTAVTDSVDPVRIGNSTTYRISIVNQGDLRAISPRLAFSLSDHLRPVQVIGTKDAAITGQTVDFGEIPLKPRGKVDLQIIATGVQAGPGKAVLTMEADFLAAPMVKEESTHVY
jgi:uncharacterized repeat protein (TIGR01451 family)